MEGKLVPVDTFDMPTEAHLAKGLLEANGLTAFLADELTVGVAWHLSNAVGGIKLQVPETDVERATGILAASRLTRLDYLSFFPSLFLLALAARTTAVLWRKGKSS